MPYDYEREVRTANSEAFLILDGENAVGRIDTHFLPGIAHIAIAIDQSLTSDQIEEIIADIDADMLNTVGSERNRTCITYFRALKSECSAMTARAITAGMETGTATGRCLHQRVPETNYRLTPAVLPHSKPGLTFVTRVSG